MACISQLARRGGGQGVGHSIEQSGAEARGVAPRPVEQAVGLVWMLVERERPALRQVVAAGGQTQVRPDLRETRPSQIDQAQWSARSYTGELAHGEVTRREEPMTQPTPKRLDECAVDIGGHVQDAVLARWCIETIACRPPEVE